MKDRLWQILAHALTICLLLMPQAVSGASYEPLERTAGNKQSKTAPARAQPAKAPAAKANAQSTASTPKKPAASQEAATAQDAMQAPPAMPATNHSGFKLFGTVGFKRPVEAAPAWADTIRRNAENPIFQPEKYFNKQVNWKTLKADLEKLDTVAQLNKIISFWNRFPYIRDIVNWGQEDYWAAPFQFLKKSGDCEDYAIVKYFTLRALGYPAEMMRIVTVYDTIRDEGHAVLAVKAYDIIYILDNLGRAVQSQDRIRNYVPQFSVNELGRWNQMKPKQ